MITTMALSNFVDLNLSTLISFISLIFAGLALILSAKHNSKNLRSRYFEKIFDKYLIKQIPNARKYIRYNTTTYKLDDIGKMMDTLTNLKNDSLYFRYSDKNFYKELTSLITKLEDFLGDCSNTSERDEDSRAKNILKIGELIEKIYSLINTESI